MADSGLKRFVSRGIRFSTTKGAATYVGIQTSADPATSFYFKLPSTLPGSTQALVVDSAGNMSYASLGAGGTVTSVSVAMPTDFTQAGGPVTTSGTISFTRNSQLANTFLGAPDGAAGVPLYRTLAVNDIPSLLAAKISNFDTQVRTSRLDQMATPSATVNMGNNSLSNLATPTNNQDAATKLYVDSVAAAASNKGSAKAASTGNISLAAPGAAIDGVALTAGDLFLAKDQTDAAENGLYVWNGASTAATRATQADTSAEVKSGMFVFVQSGTVNASNGFTLVTPDPIVLGTTLLSFTQTSGAGQILAGAGLTKTGSSIDVVGTANRITVNADSIDISASYAGQTSITTLGTITTGVWNGTAVAVANGGTGATTAAGARANLAAAGVHNQSFTNASLTSGVLTVTHGIGKQFVNVAVYDENNKEIESVDDITCSAVGTFLVDLTSFGTLAGTWNLVAVG